MFTHILVPVESAAQTSRVLAVTRLLAAHGPPHGPLNVTLVRATLASLRATRPEPEPVGSWISWRRQRGGWDRRALPAGVRHARDRDPRRGAADRADLIVLMPHGRQGLDALMHPSVTAKLLASGTAPLLIWPERLPDLWAQDVCSCPARW